MSTGEITGYAQKVSGVARAAKLIKRGVYIGTALSVASAGLKIKQACTLGREDECTKAKYVEGSSLVLSLAGGSGGGLLGGLAASYGCIAILGLTTGGGGALVCSVIGGVVGSKEGEKLGGAAGEKFGEFIYRELM
jgi:hypothetical protein